ncbi:MAG: hypothetical protein ACREMS_02365 [Gemmatimonadaceae bacterium]
MSSKIRSTSLSQVVFAVTMIGLGLLGLVTRDFTPLWVGVPQSIPGREPLAWLCALIALISGAGLLWNRTALVASRVLFGFFVIWLLFVRVPYIFIASTATDTWWACGQTAVMIAASWILYIELTREREVGPPDFASEMGHRIAIGEMGQRIATALYGLGLIPFGIAHFTYLARTVSMVPGWLPWHLAWAYFTGSAFIAAGVALVIGICARLAAMLSAWQLGLFTLLVWGPVLLAGHPTASDWSETIVSWVLTSAAWVVASSYRGVLWLTVRKRSAKQCVAHAT